jgi:hypothetical protein
MDHRPGSFSKWTSVESFFWYDERGNGCPTNSIMPGHVRGSRVARRHWPGNPFPGSVNRDGPGLLVPKIYGIFGKRLQRVEPVDCQHQAIGPTGSEIDRSQPRAALVGLPIHLRPTSLINQPDLPRSPWQLCRAFTGVALD